MIAETICRIGAKTDVRWDDCPKGLPADYVALLETLGPTEIADNVVLVRPEELQCFAERMNLSERTQFDEALVFATSNNGGVFVWGSSRDEASNPPIVFLPRGYPLLGEEAKVVAGDMDTWVEVMLSCNWAGPGIVRPYCSSRAMSVGSWCALTPPGDVARAIASLREAFEVRNAVVLRHHTRTDGSLLLTWFPAEQFLLLVDAGISGPTRAAFDARVVSRRFVPGQPDARALRITEDLGWDVMSVDDYAHLFD